MTRLSITSSVRLLHHALRQLGHAVPDLEWRAGDTGSGTRLVVAAFQRAGGLTATGELDALTVAAIEAAAAGLDRPTRIVCGHVRRVDGAAVAGAVVRAVDRDLRTEQPLGETTADTDGWYEIAYRAEQFRRAEKGQADLVVRAFAPAPRPGHEPGPETPEVPPQAADRPSPRPPAPVAPPLATSDVHFNAATVETIDLVVGGTAVREPSEFERVAVEIEPLREGIAVADFTDADAAFIAGETGLAAEWIAAFIAAHQFARAIPASPAASLVPAALYGLIRRNFSVASFGAAALRAALEGALSDNVVPASLAASLDAVIAALRAAVVAQAQQGGPGGRPPVSELIGLAVSPAVRDQFLAFQFDHAADTADFWETLATDPTLGRAAPALRQVAEVATLTDQHLPLVKQLLATLGAPTPDGLRKLARNSRADWEAILATSVDGKPIGAPPDTPGANEAERIQNYARLLYQRTADLYPTAVVAARLSRSDRAADKAIAQWLDARPDFDLATSSIDGALSSRGGTAGGGLAPDVLDGLRQLQRVHRVTPDADAQQVLLTSGLDSAQRISGVGRGSFVERYAESMGGADRAAAIHVNAEQTAARATTLYAGLSTAFNAISLPMLPNPALLYQMIPQSPALPNLATLFGTASSCDCIHCRSVYSPAAYLVDILHFLDGHGAYTTFNTRRPDVGHLRLDCANTNTPLPYIDLVNEVLECAVAGVAPGASLQTTRTAEELRLGSEHVLPAAYEILAKAKYPWRLPFDLGLATARGYLNLLGLSRHTLMTTFRDAAAPSEVEIAAEALGLNGGEAAILLDINSASELAYWGSPAGGLAELRNVAKLLERSGLSYAELEELLRTFCVNQTGTLKVQFADASCDLTGATIPALTVDSLQRIHRFVRVQRTLAWSAGDLDKIVRAIVIGAPGIAPTAAFARLTEVPQLHARLGVPLVEMASWWEAIDTWGDDGRGTNSLYDRVFLDRTVADPPYAAFQLDPANRHQLKPPPSGVRTDPTITPIYAAAVANALAISQEDLARLIPDLVPNLRTFENLSDLYRIVSLCRALKVPIGDFRLLKTITGIDPFDAPEDVASFVARVEKIHASGFSLAELAFLLGHAPTPVALPIDDALTATLAGLRAALADASRRAHDVETIPSGELTATLRQWLGIELSPELVGEAFDLIASVPKEADLVTRAAFIDANFAVFLDANQASQAKVVLLGTWQSNPFTVTAPPTVMAPDARMRYVLSKLGLHTELRVRHDIVVERLANALALATGQVAEMLGRIASDGDPAKIAEVDFQGGSASAQLASLRRFHRVAATWHAKRTTLAARLSVSADDLTMIDVIDARDAPWLGVRLLPQGRRGQRRLLLDDEALNRLDPEPFERWEALVDLASFRDRLPTPRPSMFAVAGFATSQPTPTVPEVVETLCQVTGWDAAVVNAVSSMLGLTVLVDYANGRAPLRIQAALDVLATLGVPAASVAAWIGSTVSLEAAAALKRAARARFDARRWTEVALPVQDRLREQKRDALVAYLGVRGPAFRSAADLYDEYLIDSEMSPCMLTSRVVRAAGAVQQFVERVLLNLEPTVALDQDAVHEWEWMKRYRVWEANRKVFLYPENWLDPSLRDDKTPFFKELEDALLQREVTEDTVEETFRQYLTKLERVSNLEVVAMYREQRPDDDPSVLHVFGRTAGIPHAYYYRRRIGDHVWTPWETVDLDIQSDHLAPIVVNRILHLYWLEFFEKTDQAGLTYDEIGLAWSTYKNGRWSAKQTSGEDHRLGKPEAGVGKGRPGATGATLLRRNTVIGFSATIEGRNLVLRPRALSEAFVLSNAVTEISSLRPSSARDLAVLAVKPGVLGPHAPRETWPQANVFISDGPTSGRGDGPTDDLWLSRVIDQPNSVSVLAATPTPFVLLYPHQYPDFLSREFFFHDRASVFYVRPAPSTSGVPPASSGATLRLSAGPAPATLAAEPSPSLVLELANRVAVSGVVGNPGNPPPVTVPPVTVLPGDRHRYRFETFYHPYVCEFVGLLNTAGIPGLLRRSTQQVPENLGVNGAKFFVDDYHPRTSLVDPLHPRVDVDFSLDGAYAQYNWEIFFHIPLLIADRLSQNQRFEEAQRWFHYIFNPTERSADAAPARFWQFRPFFDEVSGKLLQNLVQVMTGGSPTPALIQARAELEAQIQAWRDDPFSPHHIARLRISAYARSVVMKYLDNLIAWGDYLFRQDTIESINEATQLYVLAAHLLGLEPPRVAREDAAGAQTFNAILAQLDDFPEVVVGLENVVPVARNIALLRTAAIAPLRPSPPRLGAFPARYFCFPPNTQLLQYWTTVGERLFKIRHCMNIDGTVRELPLFAPPIDPGLLIRAKAAGLDIGAVLNDLAAPAPVYRFQVIHRTALELIADVKALGAELLSVLEKRDGELLAQLRSGHEVQLLKAVRQTKQRQIDEAKQTLEGLAKTREATTIRHDYYKNIAFMNREEIAHLTLTAASLELQMMSHQYELAAQVARLLPEIHATVPPDVQFGGANLGGALGLFAGAFNALASELSGEASMAATRGGYQRRADEWKLQENLAAKELEQLDRQILAAQIRVAIAEHELANHDMQIESAEVVDDFLRTKYTNGQLYSWMVSRIAAVYFQSYQLAYDVARRAQKAFQFELADPDASFVTFGYWDNLHQGLLAGHGLHHDLRRMETAYQERNRREYEITKHVSLALTDPMALVKLKLDGACEVALDEALFNLDYPGHYLRRIKSVGLSTPCVVGPYTSVNCTLTLLTNRIRARAGVANVNDYPEKSGDGRFIYDFAAIQSIATSGAQNDGGLFELNFRDERYLPFEGAGAISRWRIELPKETNRFDRDTISDVVLHVRYTARDGGKTLRDAVPSAADQGVRLFSVKHEFPKAWHALLTPPPNTAQMITIELTPDRLPFHAGDNAATIKTVTLWPLYSTLPEGAPEDVPPPASGWDVANMTFTPPTALDLGRLKDVWLVIAYRYQ